MNGKKGSESLGGKGEAVCLLDFAKNAQKQETDLAPVSLQNTTQETRLILLQLPVSSYLHFYISTSLHFTLLLSLQRIF